MLQLTNRFTIEDMRRFAGEAWGQLGVDVVDKWCEFNRTYFDGALKPVPLVITNTQPFGKTLAFCSYNPDANGRTITLNVPDQKHAGVPSEKRVTDTSWTSASDVQKEMRKLAQ